MNILFVSAILPYPLRSGGQIRIYNLLKRLSKHHAVTLVSFIREEGEREFLGDLDFCERVAVVMRGRAWQPKYILRTAAGAYPFLLATYQHEQMRQEIARLISEKTYDIVHIEPFYVIPSLPAKHPPLVVSEHNVEYEVYGGYARRFSGMILRPLLHWDVAKMKHWERLSWRTASAVTAVSEDDAAVIEAYVNHPVPVVPNGVDIESFPFRLPKTAESPMILFVGNFRWHPNQDAAYTLVGRIWPRLQERIKNARLRIVGKDIPAKLRRMAEGVGGQVDENAEDIASVYRQADVLVAPHAISGGTKFKMLEAMASGLPIVTTKEGASGLAMKQGIHFLSADTPDGFVTAIAAICESDITRQALAKNGRKLVESRYNWDIIAKTLEGVWQKASHE